LPAGAKIPFVESNWTEQIVAMNTIDDIRRVADKYMEAHEEDVDKASRKVSETINTLFEAFILNFKDHVKSAKIVKKKPGGSTSGASNYKLDAT
jgi:glutamyl-tRNA reductase